MLKFLHIENIAVIEACDMELTDGFNVLTGETGAGKSIIIDSINAVLGERTSKDLIRSGCDTAEVSALFGNFSPENLAVFRSFDMEPDEDGNLLISRRLSLSGKGLVKINGKPATAGILKEISGELVNIHGQHDNQALLDPEKHAGFLDAVAENQTLKEAYLAEFRNLNAIRKELRSLETDEEEKQHRTELLRYSIRELTEAEPKPGETEELKKKLAVAENFEKTYQAMTTALRLLSGDEDNDGILTGLHMAAKMMSELKNDSAERIASKFAEMITLAEDCAAELTAVADNEAGTQWNPDAINQRLDLLYKLMLKYGNSEQALLDTLEQNKKELEQITFSDRRTAELEQLLLSSKDALVAKGKALTESRTAAARIFEKQVCDILAYLNMPGVKFAAQITPSRYTKNGCDEVEFKISANAGEEMKPLHKIASGGELSRIMLAIKSALLGKDPVGTMVFDEIDAGISGFAAEKVGVQLQRVSRERQVICITHLAQIAAKADHHLLIEKKEQNGRTFTRVKTLAGEETIAEIARIMSGTEITENLYNSAKELLDRSKTHENL